MQNHGVSSLHIRRYTTKWNGKIVEAGDFGLRKSDAVQEKSHALPGVVSVGTAETVFQAQRCVDQKVAAVLLAAKRNLRVHGRWSKGFVPVNVFCKGLHLRWRHACGIHSSDNRTHAGTRDAIDRNVILFNPLDDADLGESQSTTPTESQTDARPVCSRVDWFPRISSMNRNCRGEGPEGDDKTKTGMTANEFHPVLLNC